MSCIKLINGQDSRCSTFASKYCQQAILINKADVLDYQILDSYTDIVGDYYGRHAIRFILNPTKKGVFFAAPDKGANFSGVFNKTIKEGVPQYTHIIALPLMGVSEEIKIILKQLDSADYFAALKYSDNTIEIFGFGFGLFSDYGYDPQGNSGGSIIELSSDTLEDQPPYIYKSGTGGDPLQDWENLFGENPPLPAGDFNNDFNNDFFI